MTEKMTNSKNESTKNWFEASRRTFLGASGAAVAGGLLGFTPQTASAANSQTWDVHQWMTENGWSADKAVSELVSRASEGDTILFSAADGGTEYEIGDSHVIKKAITLKGEDGAQLTRTSYWYGFKFQGPGLTGEVASMTGDVSRGDTTIPVDTSAVDFSVGDYVHIRNQQYDQVGSNPIPEHYGLQFAEVTGVSDGTIDISNQAYFDYTSNSAQVEKVELLEGAVVDGLTMVGDNNDPSVDYGNTPSERRGMFGMQWVKDGVYRNSSVKNYYASAYFFFDCWRATWDNVTAADAQSTGSGEGEGIKAAQTTGVQALSVTHRNCRRGVDILRGTTETYVKDPLVENASLIGIGHHYGTNLSVSGRLRIEGGTLSADGTTIDHIGGQTYVTGTTIKTPGSGIGIAGDNFTAEDVTIEGIDGGSGNGHAVFITGAPSNVGVRGKVVDTVGTFEHSAVRITPTDDVENLLFDLDIESDNRFYGIGMTGSTLRDVTIRGTLSSSSNNTDKAIDGTYQDAGVVDGFDISVDLTNHGGDGIDFLVGDRIDRVKIHDSTFETGGDYGIWFGYDLSKEQKVEIDNVDISGSRYAAIFLEAPGTAYIGDVNTDGEIRTGDGLTLADSSYGYTVDTGNSNAAYESLAGTPGGNSSGGDSSGGNSSGTPSNNPSDSGNGNTTGPGNETSSPGSEPNSSGDDIGNSNNGTPTNSGGGDTTIPSDTIDCPWD